MKHYSGKVCAISRFNPGGTVRRGIKGFRTLALQQALNRLGANLAEDGEYGNATADAVRAYQEARGISATGEADSATLKQLTAKEENMDRSNDSIKKIRVTGGTVNLRSGPDTGYNVVGIARKGEEYEVIDTDQWMPVRMNGEICWISGKDSLKI